MSRPPALPVKPAARRAFARAADSYDAAAALQREVSRRLQERLDLMSLTPTRVLDVGAGTGELSAALLKRYPRAQVAAVDAVPAMLRHARKRGRLWRRPACVAADAEALPFKLASIDLIASNLALPWIPDLDRALESFVRVLKPDGLLLFSSVGPDTLRELREAWAAADDAIHVHDFLDMHDVGDALMRAGFVNPVMEAERITLTYRSLDALVQDLRDTGAVNVAAGRRTGLTPRSAAAAMRAAYEHWRQPDGRLPASCEVVFGHAWAPRTLPQKRTDGAVGIPIANIGRRRKS